MSTNLNVVVTEEDSGFVALNPETGVASQGDTLQDSLKNLTEALSLYFEEVGIPTNKSKPVFLTTITV